MLICVGKTITPAFFNKTMIQILKRTTDFAIVARTFYKNVPDSELKRSCERLGIPLVFVGSGDVMSMFSYAVYRMIQHLKILPFEKVVVCDYDDTIVCGTADAFYDRLPSDGVLWSTDYQKMPYLYLNAERPIYPVVLPEFVKCFCDERTGLIYSPNGGAYGGNRLEVIKALERTLQYAEQFCMIEESGFSDSDFPFVASVQRQIDGSSTMDDQYLQSLLFYDKWRHEQEGLKFPIKIELDRIKNVFTNCQPGYTDGEAIFYHFSGGQHRSEFGKQKISELCNFVPVSKGSNMFINDFEIVVSTTASPLSAERRERLATYFTNAGIMQYKWDEEPLCTKSPFPNLHPAYYGCGAHFANILQCFGDRHILYFEDDAIVSPDFCSQLNRHLASLPDDWDIFIIGYGGVDNVRHVNQCVVTSRNFWGTQCVAVRNGAGKEKLVDAILSDKIYYYGGKNTNNIYGGFDISLPDWCSENEVGLYFASKSLVGQGGCESHATGEHTPIVGIGTQPHRKERLNIAFDFHGVLNGFPDFFSPLSRLWSGTKEQEEIGKVYILTFENQLPDYIAQQCAEFGIYYDEIILIKPFGIDQNNNHALAGAIKAKTSFIVTFNIKEFPQTVLDFFQLQVFTPDEFMVLLIDKDYRAVLKLIKHHRENLTQPSLTVDQYLAMLENQCLPKTVAFLREHQTEI